jgi:4-amino-4-deoxy-L-arabinose transferase-like glycosyltransferase/putative flippase GtrA
VQAPPRPQHGRPVRPSDDRAVYPQHRRAEVPRSDPRVPLPPERRAPPRSGSDAPPLPPDRRQSEPGWEGQQSTDRHWLRLPIFGLIGGGVFSFGLVLQVVLVQRLHMAAVPAYFAQGFTSIQLSFLLNHYLTWRDRSVPFWRALWRFNAQKALMTAIIVGVYAILIRFGVQYIVANIALTVVFTPVNYVIGHYWSFTPKRARAAVMAVPGRPGRPPRTLADSLPFGFSTIGAIPVITDATIDRLIRARAREGDRERARVWVPVDRRYLPALATVIAGGAVLRLWHLGTAPDWQMDELTYTALARNVLTHGTLNLPQAFGQPWTPFLYHPPFYFLLLARWFAITGVGIFQARLLGVIGVTVSLLLLSRLIWKVHGPLTAVVTALFLATDGWLLYVQRVSYMENILMVLVTATFLVYRKALDSHLMRWYMVAGLLGGASVIFKHTSGYVVAAFVIAWLMVRRDHRHHIALLGTSLAVTAAYVLAMLHLFDFNGHNWYVFQTLVQVRRTLGQQQTGGSLNSPLQLLHLATHQYAVFLPSLLIAFSGVILLAVDLVRSLRARNLAVFRDDVVFPAWALAGIAVFGAISITYPQYFSMVLIPVYCYLWARVVRVARHRLRPWMAVLGMALVVSIGVVSFHARVTESPGNVFQEAGQYVSTHIPRQDIVVAATPINYEIPQHWCSPTGGRISPLCLETAQYIVTWQTYLQSSNPYNYANLEKLLKNSTRVTSIPGFSGTVTIWKVNRR